MSEIRVAFIMSGVPGSGKTTIARMLAGKNGVIHSTNEYFVTDGRYVFDKGKLHEFHELNFQAFCRSLNERIPRVICDNTNLVRWHYEHYVTAAENAGYHVAFVKMPHPEPEVAAARNVHDVSADQIREMIRDANLFSGG